MVNPIKGQIISILNEYEVIINKGSKVGLKEGDRFVIYEEGEEIFDLNETSLGKLEIVKGKVKIEHVQEKFSICSAYKVKTNPSPALTNALSMALMSQSKLIGDSELIPLNVDQADLVNLKMEPKKIKIGDIVKQELD